MLGRRLELICFSFAMTGMLWGGLVQGEENAKPAQYEFETISIPGARADEPIRSAFSLRPALDYIENGALAWSKKRKCVACHTNATYMVIRPALTPSVGKPSEELHAFFVDQFRKMKRADIKKLRSGIRPTQMAYIAGGLAEWDAHVSKKLSPETGDALKLMFELQSDDGSFANTDCWPPFESSAYHGTTVAAMAAATAPGWLAGAHDEPLRERIAKLKEYLRTTTPPHDYARLLLLWASTRMPGLIDKTRQDKLIETVFEHQRSDGGWSIRTFSTPEKWGNGNRAEKLRAEPEFKNPPSDGHQTGLAVVVLRDAGLKSEDPRIQRAVKWLQRNQRESGRWWTRSLNTDKYHFITYSGTCYPLLALAKCGAIPPQQKTAAK